MDINFLMDSICGSEEKMSMLRDFESYLAFHKIRLRMFDKPKYLSEIKKGKSLTKLSGVEICLDRRTLSL
jgi:hypothetical protein